MTSKPQTPAETGVQLDIYIARGGQWRVHKAGCADVQREVKRDRLDPSWSTAYASQEEAIRDLWADQIGDNWNYDADGEPPLDYLREHGFVHSIDFLPCASALVPLDSAPRPAVRRVRLPRTAEHQGRVVAGYSIVKTTPGYDQLRSDHSDEHAAEWITRCNAHDITTPADNRKAGRRLGSSASRARWCNECAIAAAAADAAADATAEHDAASAAE
jgi:hypothetical protein